MVLQLCSIYWKQGKNANGETKGKPKLSALTL